MKKITPNYQNHFQNKITPEVLKEGEIFETKFKKFIKFLLFSIFS